MTPAPPPTADRPPGRWVVVLAALLLAGSLAELYRALHDPRAGLARVFNSDTLFPGRLYDDLVRDGYPIDGWQFPAAPFWFPDAAVYFLTRALAGSAAGGMIGYAVAQFGLLTAAAAALAAAAFPAGRRVAAAAVLVLAAGAVQVNSHAFFGSLAWCIPFLVQFHAGALVVAVAALAVVVHALRAAPGGRRQVLLLAGLVALLVPAVASDRILVVWFAAPAVAAVGAVWALGYRSPADRLPTATAAAVAAAVAVATAAGLAVHQRCHNGLHVPSLREYSDARLEYLKAGAKYFAGVAGERLAAGDVLLWAAAVAAVLAAAAAARTAARAVTDPHPPAPGTGAFLGWYYLTMVVLTAVPVTAAGLTAKEPWPFALKYLLPVFYLPFFGIAVAVAWAARRSGRPWVGTAACGVLLATGAAGLGVLANRPVTRGQSVWHYYPPEVRQLDHLAAKYDLREGLGEFWDANTCTLLSRRGVRVYPVMPTGATPWGFTGHHWLGNKYWFTGHPAAGHPPPRFTFLILGDGLTPHRSKIEAALGPPVEAVPLGHRTVLVYTRPDAVLPTVLRFDGPFITTANALPAPGRAVSYPARSLYRQTGADRPDGCRQAVAGRDPAGSIIFGPYLPVASGRYRVRLTYSAAGSSGSDWYVFHQRPPKPEVKLHHAHLPDAAGTTATTEVVVDRGDDPDALLEIRAWYSGAGTLTVHAVEVERVE